MILEGRFRLVRPLGEGGMGVVYLAEQVSLGRTVAVKVLRADLSAMAGMGERFKREALLLSSVDHPAVVRVIDYGHADGLACLVMELVEGESLEHVAATRPPLERSVRLLQQLAQGLAAIHARGIVHRDLKPENVVVTKTPDGAEQARLLDFGIARLVESDAPENNVTQAGFVLGTPEYLSPEQALGQPLDARSDLYSFGVVAYRLLSGELPFVAATPRELLAMHVQQAPRSLVELVPQAAELSAVVMQCLEKDPARRPVSAQAVAQALGRTATSEQPALVTPVLLTRTAPQPAVSVGKRSAWQLLTTTQRLMLVGLSLVLLIAFLGGAVVWFEPSRRGRALLEEQRPGEALEVLEPAVLRGESSALQLKAAALHQLNRHQDEWEVVGKLKFTTAVEPQLLDGLAEDFGKKEAPGLRELLKRVPRALALKPLQRLAEDEERRGRWGALRFVDLEYAGQGLALVELYGAALQPADCRVRAIAARRLGELRNEAALPMLEWLRAQPRNKGFLSDDECGQDAAAAAIRVISR